MTDQEKDFEEQHQILDDLLYKKYKDIEEYKEFNENLDWESFYIESKKDLKYIKENFKCIASAISQSATGTQDTSTYTYSKYVILFGKTESFYFLLESSELEYGSQASNLTDYCISAMNQEPNKIVIYDTLKSLIYNSRGLCMWDKLQLLVNDDKLFYEYLKDKTMCGDCFDEALKYFTS